MRSLLSLFVTLLLASPALADPLAIASIPSTARWVIHLDVDAGSKTPLWELARDRIVQPQREQIMPRLEALQKLTGLNFPQDLRDVTLYGSAFDESAACILIHATIDHDRTLAVLQLDKEFRSEDHNGHAILTWRDKQRDRLTYGAFFGKDIAIIAHSHNAVALALDTLDGKSPALKPDSPLAPLASATRPPFFWIAGTDFAELTRQQKIESPLVGQMDAASLAGTWADNKLTTRMQVVARTDKAAQQMLALAEGIKAMVALAAADDHATPEAKIASATLQSLNVTVDGKQVTSDWSIAIDRIESLINIAQQNAVPTVSTNVAAPPPRPAENKH